MLTCLLLMGVLALPHTTSARSQDVASIRGTVADENNDPLDGAKVRVTKLDDEALETTIAEGEANDGEFSLDVPSGTYRIVVWKDGYGDAELRDEQIEAGEPAVYRVHLSKSTMSLDSAVSHKPQHDYTPSEIVREPAKKSPR